MLAVVALIVAGCSGGDNSKRGQFGQGRGGPMGMMGGAAQQAIPVEVTTYAPSSVVLSRYLHFARLMPRASEARFCIYSTQPLYFKF